MTTTQDPIAHAARLLREAAEELRQAHTYHRSEGWQGETGAQSAYDVYMAAAQALEDWEAAVGAGGVQALSAAPAVSTIPLYELGVELRRELYCLGSPLIWALYRNGARIRTLDKFECDLVDSTLLAASPTPTAEQQAAKAAPAWADQAVIEYRYTGGTHWCPLGPAERMKPDFDGVYRLQAGVYPVEQAAPKAAPGEPAAIKMVGYGGCTGINDYLMSDGTIKTMRPHEVVWREAPQQAAPGDEGKALAALRYYMRECSGAEPSISVFHRMVEEALGAAPQQEAQELVVGMGIPLSCGKPLCSPGEHHPLCHLASLPAPQPAPAPLSDEREAFESTWENLYGKKPVLWDTAFKEAKMDVPAHSAGKYFYRDAQAAWKAWQARAALAAQGGK